MAERRHRARGGLGERNGRVGTICGLTASLTPRIPRMQSISVVYVDSISSNYYLYSSTSRSLRSSSPHSSAPATHNSQRRCQQAYSGRAPLAAVIRVFLQVTGQVMARDGVNRLQNVLYMCTPAQHHGIFLCRRTTASRTASRMKSEQYKNNARHNGRGTGTLPIRGMAMGLSSAL